MVLPAAYLRSVLVTFIIKACSREESDEKIVVELGGVLARMLRLGESDMARVDAAFAAFGNRTWWDDALSNAPASSKPDAGASASRWQSPAVQMISKATTVQRLLASGGRSGGGLADLLPA